MSVFRKTTKKTSTQSNKNTRTKRVWSEQVNPKVEAILATGREDIRYITGFSGSEALLLLTRDRGFLVVDSRYTNQARSECVGVVVVESNDRIGEISRVASRAGVKRVGFEPRQLTFFQHEELKKKGDIEWMPLADGLDEIRQKKDLGEKRLLKKAAKISSNAFLDILGEIKAGIEERAVSLLLEFQIRKNGAEATPFPFIVASGKRGSLPHGLASGKKIRRGEFVTVDFGAVYEGYCSDETCTVVVGKPTKKQKSVYQVVKDAHEKAISRIRPGVRKKNIDRAARGVIEKAGLGKYFGHGTGHGVGLAVHEEPRIAPRQKGVIEAGMVFTIEPGVYIPGWGGVRIEDMVWVTRDGCELMSSVPKKLICL